MGRGAEVNERARYSVLAERADRPGEEGMWMVRVPELGLASAALREDDVETTARGMIATALHVDAGSFDLDIESLTA